MFLTQNITKQIYYSPFIDTTISQPHNSPLILEVKLPDEPVCPSPAAAGLSVDRSVCHNILKFHFHAPIGGLVKYSGMKISQPRLSSHLLFFLSLFISLSLSLSLSIYLSISLSLSGIWCCYSKLCCDGHML